ncbi:MAG: hypothetical protein HXX09_02330 [Bacteroidetes bacterium]|nr:hypothetical protein [Bacteroidota bacterium]
MKKFFILIVFLSSACYAQDDIYKSCLKKTSIAIYSAQKSMLVSNMNDLNGKFAKSILLQSNSIQLFGKNDLKLSICYALAARELAIEIVQEIKKNSNIDPYYQILPEEKQLNSSCLELNEMLLNGKRNFPYYSERDKDFLDPLGIKNYIEVK